MSKHKSMLERTFCHIDGIGPQTERKLWKYGITSWDHWPERFPFSLPSAVRAIAIPTLAASRDALEQDPGYFAKVLKTYEMWRLFPSFREKTAYLDIETTGLEDWAEVTTIALYDGDQVKVYVSGENLQDFQDDIMAYQVIVSYNGKSFDVPYLEKAFRMKLPQAQIDLRHVLARLGFKGGLKGCEKALGLHRGGLDGVDGSFAVVLWRQYQNTGDRRYLETLLAYNVEDTVNLERLMVEAYNRNVAKTPFAQELQLPHPGLPPNPFTVHQQCLEEIRRAIRPQPW